MLSTDTDVGFHRMTLRIRFMFLKIHPRLCGLRVVGRQQQVPRVEK